MRVEAIGLVDYRQTLQRQLLLVEECRQTGVESLLVCSHPSIVTLGRRSSSEDVFAWEGDILPIQRGGKATYHGPGQMVCYPIIDLRRRDQDIFAYLRALEQSIVASLEFYGLKGRGHEEKATGVWVEGKKIASIGVAVKRWITYHGLAVNLEYDSLAFQGIHPCGFQRSDMTSLEELCQRKISREEFQNILIEHLLIFLKEESK